MRKKFDEDDDGNLPDRVPKEEGKHMFDSSILTDSICSEDEKNEAMLLGEWVTGEETQPDGSTVTVTISKYNGKMYVLDSKHGVIKL